MGGPHEPYRQSQRLDIYKGRRGQAPGGRYAYECYSSPEEVEARHRAAGRDPKLGYDNFDRELTVSSWPPQGRGPQAGAARADAGRGRHLHRHGPREITFKAGSIPDYVIVRADGSPLYTLVNPVDDALMGITHVLRGEDLLSSTPRHVVLIRALMDIASPATCRCSATCPT